MRTTSRHQGNALDPRLLTPIGSDPSFPAVVNCSLDCWLSFWRLTLNIVCSPWPQCSFLLHLYFLSPFQPILWGLNKSLSACPREIMIQRKRLHYSSHTLHKQSSLNIQHYSKRQVPLKIRTSQQGEFYYDTSSQTQTNRLSERQAAVVWKGRHTTTEMSQSSHTCQGSPENLRKGKWRREVKLLSEWSTRLSGSWTELVPLATDEQMWPGVKDAWRE